LAAIEGAPLGKVDAYIPASPYPGRHVASDRVRAPGIVWTHDYAAAMVRSKAEHRPIFINFTGYTCTNCRLMEQEVFPRQDVQRVLAAYIPVELYTDDNAVGPADQKIEQELAHVLTLPVYVIVPTDGSAPIVQQGAVFDGRLFAEFVRSGLPAVASASQ
jgi:thiol:disulfide interchange protein DsbD